MELLIRGAKIVDYSVGVGAGAGADAEADFVADVYIKDGIINEIGKNLIYNCESIEGEGLMLLPSFVDLHAHFRDPGLTYKEDLLSGSRAAVKGGYTTVNLMANTKPICSSMEIVDYVQDRIKEIGLIDVHQMVSITKDMDGKSLEHLYQLDNRVKFISDDGKGVVDNEIMLLAMKWGKAHNVGIMSHAEFETLNKYDTRLSENLMTQRDIELSKFTGCHLHMAHVSTIEAMTDIINAKKSNHKVTCEVTPHHIALIDSSYRVNPPIRKQLDVEFLISAIKDAWVDAIGTDHAPHTAEDKLNGSPGMTGIETAFSVCYTKLVKENGVTIKRLSEIMSKRPAELLGLNKGRIQTGFDGDLVLVDLNKKFSVDAQKFESKGKNTPFDGMELYGEIKYTIKGGKIVYRNMA